MLGRDEELARLRAVLGGRAGTRSAVLLQGGYGSGKSALLRALRAEELAAGRAVLSATAEPLESTVEFAVARQLFDDVHAGERGTPPVPRPLTGPGATAEAAGEALYAAVAAHAAHRPVLVAVDDLQHADAASLRWLGYLIRRADDLPLTVLATLGPGEPGEGAHEDELADLLRLLPRQQHLLPLDEDTVHRLAVHALGERADRAVAAACRTATAGNPLLLQALLRTLATSPGRPGEEGWEEATAGTVHEIRPAVRALLGDLGAEAEATATTLAVLGGAQSVELVSQTAGLSAPVTQDTLHRLTRLGLVVVTGAGLVRAACPLLEAAEAACVAPSRRRELHGRAADLLRGWAAPCEQIAAHLVRCDSGRPWADAVLRDAAALAAGRGDPARAAAYLRRTRSGTRPAALPPERDSAPPR
ncbi:ATP-binding protein, partial [Streptomyces durbertensis]